MSVGLRTVDNVATEAWCEAYCAAFVEFAVSRGWHRQTAEAWADDLSAESFVECGDQPAHEVAEEDVIMCELDNAQ